jgi:hypothetical protein
MRIPSPGAIYMFISIVILSIGAWIANIVKLFCLNLELTAELFLRVIGVFIFPIGTIMGFV